MTKLIGLTWALALIACGGGGGGSPAQQCKDGVAATCERFYACLSAAEIAAIGYPPTEAGCVTQQETSNGCDNATAENACTGNETYHSDKADMCIDQISGLDCSQLRDPNFNLDTAAPACSLVCAID